MSAPDKKTQQPHWIPYTHACGYYTPGYLCSNCRSGSLEELSECPFCGAKVSKEKGGADNDQY